MKRPCVSGAFNSKLPKNSHLSGLEKHAEKVGKRVFFALAKKTPLWLTWAILRSNGNPYDELITYVKDRPGHDHRYAIDSSKIKNKLGWTPNETFETGIRKTIQWYLDNENWWRQIQDGTYSQGRLGLKKSN